MKRKTDWRLDGWVYEEQLNSAGKLQKKLVYRGEYYSLGLDKRGLRKLKFAYLLLAVLVVASYVTGALAASPGAARIFVGAAILALIPLMYLLIGVGCLLPVKPEMTYRDQRASCVRLRWTSAALTALMLFSALGEALCPILSPANMIDSLWLAANLICSLASLTILVLEHRFRPRMLPKAL